MDMRLRQSTYAIQTSKSKIPNQNFHATPQTALPLIVGIRISIPDPSTSPPATSHSVYSNASNNYLVDPYIYAGNTPIRNMVRRVRNDHPHYLKNSRIFFSIL
jgi:hypothetical protein